MKHDPKLIHGRVVELGEGQQRRDAGDDDGEGLLEADPKGLVDGFGVLYPCAERDDGSGEGGGDNDEGEEHEDCEPELAGNREAGGSDDDDGWEEDVG